MASKSKVSDPLGMDASITRRDFIGSTLVASGAALLSRRAPAKDAVTDEFTGYGGLGDYATSNGNTLEVVTAGHQMRDGVLDRLDAVDTEIGRASCRERVCT